MNTLESNLQVLRECGWYKHRHTSLFETFGDDFPNSYFTNSVPAIIAFYSNNQTVVAENSCHSWQRVKHGEEQNRVSEYVYLAETFKKVTQLSISWLSRATWLSIAERKNAEKLKWKYEEEELWPNIGFKSRIGELTRLYLIWQIQAISRGQSMVKNKHDLLASV